MADRVENRELEIRPVVGGGRDVEALVRWADERLAPPSARRGETRTVGVGESPVDFAACAGARFEWRCALRSVVRQLAERIEEIEQLDGAGKMLKSLVDRYVPPRTELKDLLSGTWLGHPLHPVLTDVVVGAWTGSLLLDLTPGRRTRKASDRLVDVGILAAVPTALAGLSDWADVWGRPRRVGLVHASANVLALYLYVSSSVARKRGRRQRGWWLSASGFGVITVSAYLGGHLSFGKGVGVDQTAFEEGPTDWQPAIRLDDLRDGQPTPATVGGVEVLLVKQGATIHAISDRCSHRGCSLHEGEFPGETTVVCPCHGSTFSLQDGALLHGPATAPQPAYLTRVRDGKVEVRLAHA
jgi:nitrite reductase/ring-hydroxylating ferredoxin subunit